MADFKLIAEHYPAARDFRDSDIIGFRGDVLSYWANMRKPSLSTDAQGFRHTVLGDKEFSLVDCTQSPRWGIVLGPSTIFASGFGGNEGTMASRLSERFGFPFANGAMPGANSRNINSLLVGLLAAAKQPPAVIAISNGGDLGNFCETGFADPIFGSPNHIQIRTIREAGHKYDTEAAFFRLLVFTKLWGSVTANLCKARNIPLVGIYQPTFFEKNEPTPLERHFKLGEPRREGQEQLFANLRHFSARFIDYSLERAKDLGIPVGGIWEADRLSFVDEVHLDADSVKLLSEAVGDTIEPLLGAEKPDTVTEKESAA